MFVVVGTITLPVFLPFEIHCSLHISVLALHGALLQKGQKAKPSRQNAEETFWLTTQSGFFTFHPPPPPHIYIVC